MSEKVSIRERLFALNQIDIFCSSTFISLNSLLIYLLDKNKFLSSANMTGFKIEEALKPVRMFNNFYTFDKLKVS